MSVEGLTAEPLRRKYGNFRRPGFRLFRISLLPATAVFVTVVIAVFALMLEQWWVCLLAVVLLAVVELPLLWPSPGGARYVRLGRWGSHRLAQRAGRNVLLQGPVGKTPDGLLRLPGLAAQTQLSEHTTSLGDPFGLISWPKTAGNLHTVVMHAHPTGTTGRDQSTVDGMVAQHGALLRLLGEQLDVVGAAAVVQTSPDSGLRLRRGAMRGVVDDAPEFARAAMEGTLAKLTSGSPALQAAFTITFKGTKPGTNTAISTEEIARDLGARLPFILGQARLTGAGATARWATAQQIVDHTAAAYNATAAADIEAAVLDGSGTGLTWTDVGPGHAVAEYEDYVHDGALSRTWVWVRPPQSAETEDILAGLLQPHHRIPHKRVSIQYRPLTPEASQAGASQGVRETNFGGSVGRFGAAKARDVQFAKKAEQEESEGAVLVRASVMITVTAFSREELEDAAQAVRQVVRRSHLSVRVARGMSDTAFLATLPLGLVIPQFLPVPDRVRDQL